MRCLFPLVLSQPILKECASIYRRFAELLEASYFTECRFHRVVPGFIIQWGIPADPAAYQKFGDNKIRDDPVAASNTRGTISFATSGPHARGSQMFVNLNDNSSNLDDQGYGLLVWGPCLHAALQWS